MHKIRTWLMTVAVLGLALGNAGCNEAATAMGGKQKVVYHVNYDDPAEQAAALRNIQNHINAEGAEHLDIRVVMHGKGVSMVKRAKDDMDLQSKIVSLKQQQVAFNVCNNTLRGKNIDPDADLFDVTPADIVPSGVAELARLQARGFAYIKP